MDPTKTIFGDFRQHAAEIIRVQTESSVYFVAFHEERGRRYVVVRGEQGSDREHVVVRDSDPRIGDRSMFEVPIEEWPGQVMEAATMRTSLIVTVTREHDPTGTSFPSRVVKPRVEPPPGMSEHPRVMSGGAKGTQVGKSLPAQPPAPAIAQQVVVGDASPPYPERHVRYAEDVAALLRSLHRREGIFHDVTAQQRERLISALEDAQDLINLVLRRAKR